MKGSIAAASAALVASAAAAAHNGHAGFHLRRHPAADICTVYTTIYVQPSGTGLEETDIVRQGY
jgi:hypothetical protein